MDYSFLNLTSLEDSEARTKLEKLRELVLKAERDREDRVTRDEQNREFWRSKVWTDEDTQLFFDALGVRPYNFPVHRTLLNNLVTRQRNRRLSFEIAPTDINSYKRYKTGLDNFLQNNLDNFGSITEATEYYNRYADDEYAKACNAYLHYVRNENSAKYVESEIFERGLISGLDFFKCVFSKKNNKEGGVEISRRPQNAIFYDESSLEYDLKDIEYIGEVQLLYKSQLIMQYPQHRDLIEQHFAYYTNVGKNNVAKLRKDWKYFYNFDRNANEDSKVKLAEIYFLDTEKRFTIKDKETGDVRLVKEDIQEDEIADNILSYLLMEYADEAKNNPEIKSLFDNGTIKDFLASVAQDKYEIGETYEPIFYRAVFTFNALLEFSKSPFPHGSHPYYPFYCNYTEGEFNSLVDDIKDVVRAINKALSFREVMMAHSAKGLVIVDEDAITKSGYSVEDIAEVWTSIGGVIALKLREGKRISDVFDTVTTVGQGIDAINNVLLDLDNRLYQISGVNLAQLGVVQRETTSSGFRMQVAEGESNNGLIYDNFLRSMEGFYKSKVVPMIVWMLKNKNLGVIRTIGDEYASWINVDLGEEFNLFDSAIRNGEFNLTLKPINDNAQLDEERSAKYMEMAIGGILDPEIAIEFSTHPDRYKLLKRIKEKRTERMAEEQYNMINLETVKEIAMKQNLPFDSVMAMIEEMKKTNAEAINKENFTPSPKTENAQGAQSIKSTARESGRMNSIERSTQM